MSPSKAERVGKKRIIFRAQNIPEAVRRSPEGNVRFAVARVIALHGFVARLPELDGF